MGHLTEDTAQPACYGSWETVRNSIGQRTFIVVYIPMSSGRINANPVANDSCQAEITLQGTDGQVS